MWVVRDVTRDSVIITRDSAVIRNHTDGKSQGHKTTKIAKEKEQKVDIWREQFSPHEGAQCS
jgi:hypothetical protein